jgi:dienelactone hydrolase
LKLFFQPPQEFDNDFGDYRSPLKFYDGRPVKTAEDWGLRRQEILDKWHKLMGPWPELLEHPAVRILKEERDGNLTIKSVELEIAPGKKTSDAFLVVPDGEGPFPSVVVVYYDAKTGIGQGKSQLRDFALQLAKRGFVALSLGSAPETYYPDKARCRLQPLSFHAYEAATCHTILANMKRVDLKRIGIVGHSYGGKWAMFASCLYDKFACAAWSDGGIVFDESRSNVNYWERWYLGFEPGGKDRQPGIPNEKNPRTGAYKQMVEEGFDLHELHALMAPRPFLVSGGAEDQPKRWIALNHAIAVNALLGFKNRVAMTNRKTHSPTEESNEQLYSFFEHFLKP